MRYPVYAQSTLSWGSEHWYRIRSVSWICFSSYLLLRSLSATNAWPKFERRAAASSSSSSHKILNWGQISKGAFGTRICPLPPCRWHMRRGHHITDGCSDIFGRGTWWWEPLSSSGELGRIINSRFGDFRLGAMKAKLWGVDSPSLSSLLDEHRH